MCLNEHFSIYHNVNGAGILVYPHICSEDHGRLVYQFCQEGRGIGIDAAIHPVEAPLRQIPLRETSPWQVSFVCPQNRAEEPLFQELLAVCPQGK